ncbi:hypothetical protein AOLI_G00258670 [Acnodon oligacanthus]
MSASIYSRSMAGCSPNSQLLGKTLAKKHLPEQDRKLSSGLGGTRGPKSPRERWVASRQHFSICFSLPEEREMRHGGCSSSSYPPQSTPPVRGEQWNRSSVQVAVDLCYENSPVGQPHSLPSNARYERGWGEWEQENHDTPRALLSSGAPDLMHEQRAQDPRG